MVPLIIYIALYVKSVHVFAHRYTLSDNLEHPMANQLSWLSKIVSFIINIQPGLTYLDLHPFSLTYINPFLDWY